MPIEVDQELGELARAARSRIRASAVHIEACAIACLAEAIAPRGLPAAYRPDDDQKLAEIRAEGDPVIAWAIPGVGVVAVGPADEQPDTTRMAIVVSVRGPLPLVGAQRAYLVAFARYLTNVDPSTPHLDLTGAPKD